MSEMQVLPIVKVDARYGPLGGKYPERIRIAMADGTTQWYVKEVKQPSPACLAACENIRNMKAMVVGYPEAPDGTEWAK